MNIEPILHHIKEYGFIIKPLLREEHIYHCVNDLSKIEFILICIEDSSLIFQSFDFFKKHNYNNSIKRVYLIYVKNNLQEVIELLESSENQDKTFLVYDEKEEIEFFLKDLWNTIISLKYT